MKSSWLFHWPAGFTTSLSTSVALNFKRRTISWPIEVGRGVDVVCSEMAVEHSFVLHRFEICTAQREAHDMTCKLLHPLENADLIAEKREI